MARPADPLARPKLLRAARQVFASVGLEGARVEDIAKKAQMSKGAFYLHFKSKDEAFRDIIDHFFVEVARFAESACLHLEQVESCAEAAELIRTHDLQMLEFLWANRDLLEIIHSSAGVLGFQHVLHTFIDARAQEIADNIRVLQARGLYRTDLDPMVCAWLITGGWDALCRQMCQAKTKPDFGVWVDTYLKLVVASLGAEQVTTQSVTHRSRKVRSA